MLDVSYENSINQYYILAEYRTKLLFVTAREEERHLKNKLKKKLIVCYRRPILLNSEMVKV